MTTFYLDPVNGNDAADGSTFALGGLPTVGPWKTITSGPTAARIAPGDVIRIAKSPDPTSLGQTALWTNLSRDVVLQTGAVTLNFDLCENAWTASANVTATADTAQYKEGAKSAKIAIAAGFTTGLAAYKDLGSSIDFSSYQQISFWIRNSVALTAGYLQIKLCSDSAGATPVDANHVFNIPAIPSVNQWVPITIDKGGAFGTVRSIALYVVTDFGAVDIYLDNLIACKAPSAADALTLQSLISKNSAAQGGAELWYPIQSINGATIKIDNGVNTLGNAGRGYTGTTETVTIYKRETIKTTMVAAASTAVQSMQDSGTIGSLIEFQGGYNTSNNTQDGETLFDGLNGFGNGLHWTGHNYFKLNWLGTARYYNGFNANAWTQLGDILSNLRALGCSNYGFYASDYRQQYTVGNLWSNNNSSIGILLGAPGTQAIAGTAMITCGNIGYNMQVSWGNMKLATVISKNSSGANGGIILGGSNCRFNTITSADNANPALAMNGGDNNVIENFNYNESLALSTADPWCSPVRCVVGNVNGTAADVRTLTRQGIIYPETSVRHTASGYAWRLAPTDANVSATVPLWLKVAEIAVNANALVTVKAWLRRSNTGLTVSLVCRGGQIAGVDNDVKVDMTANADTWEEVTLTFTPSAAGVVEIEAWAYGGTTYSGYIDDMTISQAA